MSISGIDLSIQTLSTQSTSSVNSVNALTSTDNQNQTSSISGPDSNNKGDGQHGSMAFMHEMMQILHSFGLNFSLSSSDDSSNSSNSTDPNNTQSVSGSSSNNIGQLLNNFLHDLQQALHGQSDHHAIDNEGSSNSSAPPPNGHAHFIHDLQKLISSIGNSNGDTDPNNVLQTDFSSLINAIMGSSSSSSTDTSTQAPPTLTDVLGTMLNNASQMPVGERGAGSIISTQV